MVKDFAGLVIRETRISGLAAVWGLTDLGIRLWALELQGEYGVEGLRLYRF